MIQVSYGTAIWLYAAEVRLRLAIVLLTSSLLWGWVLHDLTGPLSHPHFQGDAHDLVQQVQCCEQAWAGIVPSTVSSIDRTAAGKVEACVLPRFIEPPHSEPSPPYQPRPPNVILRPVLT